VLTSCKENQYLVFYFDDGKNVKYNLATGETIGKLGKPVKDICTQLRGYDLLQVINSFENENYKNFLSFLDKNFINKSTSSRNSWHRVNRITNIGSFLSRIDKYKYFEQYFACGIKRLDRKINYKLNEIPKNLIRICKMSDIELSDSLIENYKKNPDLFANLLNYEYLSINKKNILGVLYSEYYYKNKFDQLINHYNYKPISLLQYIDNLMTYEALDNFYSVVGELLDYCNMMSKISPKYEKYPKNFLTTHKIATRNYNRLIQQFIEEDFKKVINFNLEYTYNNYKIIYPKTTQDIKDEAVQQNHCVASYIQNVIDGKTHILFLRDKENLEKSLVTLEVKNYKVVQAKGKFNRDVTKEEQFIINKYNEKLIKIYNKEKEKIAC
jgi:hypothetical protein